ncbi:hypothetical protein ABTM10_19415, partial [Acinetobacter baumannii]
RVVMADDHIGKTLVEPGRRGHDRAGQRLGRAGAGRTGMGRKRQRAQRKARARPHESIAIPPLTCSVCPVT